MSARRCAYLTMQNPEGWTIDAELAFPPLRAMGWSVEALPWREEDVDWHSYDAVYIGTPWDYPEDAGLFMRLLQTVDRSKAVLVNDLALVSWSMPKTYLRDLAEKNVAVVPSIWCEQYESGMLHEAFARFDSYKLVVKPVISTNAVDTFPVARPDAREFEPALAETFDKRPCVIQPFMSNIQSEGEYSLFYFNREYSHAIRKTPAQGDFRVQEEYGAEILAVNPDPALKRDADRLLQHIDPMPVYARADFVRGEQNEFYLMELELVEPSMYLRMDNKAPQRFAKAFNEYYERVSGN